MNDLTVIDTGTEIAVPEPTTLVSLLSSKGAIRPFLDELQARMTAKAETLSPETSKGREGLKSISHNVSKAKVKITAQGDLMKEDAQKLIKSVNSELKTVTEFCDTLRDKIKKPALEWEAADDARKDRLKLRLDAFRPQSVPSSSEDLNALIAEVEGVLVDETWQEFQDEAFNAKMLCLNRLDEHLSKALERERIAAEAEAKAAADAAEAMRLSDELAQLRAEKAARDETDRLRLEAERKIAADALAEQQSRDKAEQDKRNQRDLADHLIHHIKAAAMGMIDAQPCPFPMLIHEVEHRVLRDIDGCGDHRGEVMAVREAALLKLEAAYTSQQRQAAEQAEQERAEAARTAALEAEAQAARDKEAAEARHQQELEAVKAKAEADAQAERERIATAAQAEAEAAAKRAADQAHVDHVLSEIAEDLQKLAGHATPLAIAEALMAGEIRHCTVML